MVAVLNALAVRRLLGEPPWFSDLRKAALYVLITAGISPAIVALGGAFVPILGGASKVEHKPVKGGAARSKGSLQVSGEVAKGMELAWAGVIFWPGEKPMAAANLASRKGVSFSARGDGKTYEILVFTEAAGRIPARRPFVAGKAWKTYDFPFSAFEGADGHDVTGIAFVAGPAPGKFRFQLDDVKLP